MHCYINTPYMFKVSPVYGTFLFLQNVGGLLDFDARGNLLDTNGTPLLLDSQKPSLSSRVSFTALQHLHNY